MQRPHFVATPWRDGSELFELRRWFYGGKTGDGEGLVDRRREGVDKVLAWRARKPELPLLLDSTADLVDAVLQDEAGLEASALRLVYAAAVARFITGLTDTTLDLRRSRPHWHIPPSSSHPNTSSHPTSDPFNTSTTTTTTSSPSTFLDLPPHLLETRHNIVHRHLPPLFVLKQAARDSLKWLWDAYWSLLDIGLAGPGQKNLAERESLRGSETPALRDTLQGILKTYLRARKAELLSSSSSGGARKTRAKASSNADSQFASTSTSAAADTALFSLTTMLPVDISSRNVRPVLLDLLVLSPDRLILPSVKRGVGSHDDNKKGANMNMAGAFLLWGPLVLLLSSSSTHSFLADFTSSLLTALDTSHTSNDETAARGLHAWILHLLSSTEFSFVRQRCKVVQTTLEACFTVPSAARLAVAEAILKNEDVEIEEGEREMWVAVLEAARSEGGGEGEVGEGGEREEDAMQIDSLDAEGAPESSRVAKTAPKKCGPQKYVGLWRPRPIGWVGGD